MRTDDIVVMEMDCDLKEGETAGKKRKVAPQKCKLPTKRARNVGSDKKKKGKTKTTTKVKKQKLEKPPKAKVDKSNPNWRLKPNDKAPDWKVDPLFESHQPLPFVSSLGHSRLVIRAVVLETRSFSRNASTTERKSSACMPSSHSPIA